MIHGLPLDHPKVGRMDILWISSRNPGGWKLDMDESRTLDVRNDYERRTFVYRCFEESPIRLSWSSHQKIETSTEFPQQVFPNIVVSREDNRGERPG